mmetsp:Transcript_84193/g.186863  ORF Transcript_84193/g.186863 Transcript_84193/m.186863 type:complete len:479 (-) Transcript_84193:5-1441(-)
MEPELPLHRLEATRRVLAQRHARGVLEAPKRLGRAERIAEARRNLRDPHNILRPTTEERTMDRPHLQHHCQRRLPRGKRRARCRVRKPKQLLDRLKELDKTLLDRLAVELLADEDHLAIALLVFPPVWTIRRLDYVGDSVENEFRRSPHSSEHTFGAVELALLLRKRGDDSHPPREGQRVHLHAFTDDAEATDCRVVPGAVAVAMASAMAGAMAAAMVLMAAAVAVLIAIVIALMATLAMAAAVAVAMSAIRLLGYDLRRIEGADLRELLGGHNAFHRADDRRRGVVGPDRAPDLHCLCIGHEIELVKQYLVSKSKLLVPLLVILATLALFQPTENCLRVDESDRPIELEVPCNVWSLSQGPHNWHGVRHACGLHQNGIELAACGHLLADGIEGAQQVSTHSATHATVLHDDHLFRHAQGGVLQQLVVNGHRAELVLDHRKFLLALMQEQVVEHCRLSRPQEASEDGDRDWLFGGTRL